MNVTLKQAGLISDIYDMRRRNGADRPEAAKSAIEEVLNAPEAAPNDPGSYIHAADDEGHRPCGAKRGIRTVSHSVFAITNHVQDDMPLCPECARVLLGRALEAEPLEVSLTAEEPEPATRVQPIQSAS